MFRHRVRGSGLSVSEFTMVVKKSALDHVKRSMEEVLAARHGSQLSLQFTEPSSTSGLTRRSACSSVGLHLSA